MAAFTTSGAVGCTCHRCGHTDSTGSVVFISKVNTAASSHLALETLAKFEREEHRARVRLENKMRFWCFLDGLWSAEPAVGPLSPNHKGKRLRKDYGTSNGLRPVPMLC